VLPVEAAIAAWGIALGWSSGGGDSCVSASVSGTESLGGIEIQGWSSQLALRVVAVWWLLDVVWAASWKAALRRKTISSIATSSGSASCREADAVEVGGTADVVQRGSLPLGLAGRCGQWLACGFNRKLLQCVARIDDEVNIRNLTVFVVEFEMRHICSEKPRSKRNT